MTSGTTRPQSGQSLIETCIALALICLIFMGLFQISQLFAAKEILNHAAARGARAKTVGFNWWMVEKAVRVAAIPNAGRMTVPDFSNDDAFLRQAILDMNPGQLWETALSATPSSMQYGIEQARIPDYMYSIYPTRAGYILDYEDWDTVYSDHGVIISTLPDGTPIQPIITVRTYQDTPLWVPMHRAFYRADSIRLNGVNTLESHYDYYLNDMFW